MSKKVAPLGTGTSAGGLAAALAGSRTQADVGDAVGLGVPPEDSLSSPPQPASPTRTGAHIARTAGTSRRAGDIKGTLVDQVRPRCGCARGFGYCGTGGRFSDSRSSLTGKNRNPRNRAKYMSSGETPSLTPGTK